MYRACIRTAAVLLVPTVMAALTGCGDKTAKEVAAMNKSNIQRLANLYSAHQTYKGGRGPANEAEFKEFIKNFDAEKLQMMGTKSEDLPGLFTSERDGKPFKIRYNVGGGRGSIDPVVFETDGKDGKKQVGYTGGNVEDVDDQTYEQLWAGKGGGGKQSTGGRPSGPPAGAKTGPG
jgi:hypothetical protein